MKLFTIFFLIVFAFVFTASAGTVLFDAHGSPNSWPLNEEYGVGLYQQSYAGTTFGGPVEITGVTFFLAPYAQGAWNLELGLGSLSTSQALSEDYSQNLGSGYTEVFSGNGAPTGGTAHFEFATPFKFYAGAGNELILTVNMLQNNNCMFCDAEAGYEADLNRVYKLGGYWNTYYGSTVGEGCGIKTLWDTQAIPGGIPEPGTAALLIVGGLILTIRRRRYTSANS